MPKLSIRRNRDRTITVRVDRMVEHVSTDGKSKAQVFDAVKYAAISKGAMISDVRLAEVLGPRD